MEEDTDSGEDTKAIQIETDVEEDDLIVGIDDDEIEESEVKKWKKVWRFRYYSYICNRRK